MQQQNWPAQVLRSTHVVSAVHCSRTNVLYAHQQSTSMLATYPFASPLIRPWMKAHDSLLMVSKHYFYTSTAAHTAPSLLLAASFAVPIGHLHAQHTPML